MIHRTALIDPTAQLGADVAVGPYCIIGPHVSIATGARLRHAVVRDSIINQNARVENVLLEASVVGDSAIVMGRFKRVNVGDSSELSIT